MEMRLGSHHDVIMSAEGPSEIKRVKVSMTNERGPNWEGAIGDIPPAASFFRRIRKASALIVVPIANLFHQELNPSPKVCTSETTFAQLKCRPSRSVAVARSCLWSDLAYGESTMTPAVMLSTMPLKLATGCLTVLAVCT